MAVLKAARARHPHPSSAVRVPIILSSRADEALPRMASCELARHA